MYPCQYCAKAYAWSHDLKRHLKAKHTEEQGSSNKGPSTSVFHRKVDECRQPYQFQQQQQQTCYPKEVPGCFADSIHPPDWQEWTQKSMDPGFNHPFTCIIAGPTGSGKSHFVSRLLAHADNLIHPPPEKVLWYYGEWQPLYDTITGVEFVEGLPDVKTMKPTCRTLIVVDDLMAETDDRITKLFTKASHHRDISVVYIVQNLFGKNKEHRTISLNAQYMVLFKNPRDASQITHLAKQMYPKHIKYVQEAFGDATSAPYGYLLVDLKQDTPEHLRLRTSIFPGEVQFVYLRK